MSQQEHQTQLLAARDAGFEEAYMARLASLRKVANVWICGDVPRDIVQYELLKRLWLEFFADDMNSICPYRDPAPDRLAFSVPACWATGVDKEEFENTRSHRHRQEYRTKHGQLRLRSQPEVLAPTPAAQQTTSTPLQPLLSGASIPERPRNPDPRALKWQAVARAAEKTPEQARLEDLKDAERLAAIQSQDTDEQRQQKLRLHLDMVAAGERAEREMTRTNVRIRTCETFSYVEESQETSSEATGEGKFADSS